MAGKTGMEMLLRSLGIDASMFDGIGQNVKAIADCLQRIEKQGKDSEERDRIFSSRLAEIERKLDSMTAWEVKTPEGSNGLSIANRIDHAS